MKKNDNEDFMADHNETENNKFEPAYNITNDKDLVVVDSEDDYLYKNLVLN